MSGKKLNMSNTRRSGALEQSGEQPSEFLSRHASGDWGRPV